MRRGRRAGASWPTAAQELLLRAALAEGDEAVAAWRSWTSATRLEALDAGSQRLLPLLYRNLLEVGAEDPRIAKLKGAYRHAWYRNQVLLDRGAAALRALAAAEIDTVVLKGAALATLYYRDVGARPMRDFDVLVRRRDALRAIEALRADGWRSHQDRPEVRIAATHDALFVDSGGRELDLHCDVLWQVADEDRFWSEAIAVTVGGAPTRAPGHVGQLIHVCVHGLRFGLVEPIRWVADAMKVIRVAGAGLDWDELVRVARARQLTLATGRSLGYLRDVFGAAVPAEAVEALETSRRTPFERVAFAAALGRPNPAASLAILWDRHRRLSRSSSGGTRGGFAQFVAAYWGLERRAELPKRALSVLRASRWREVR